VKDNTTSGTDRIDAERWKDYAAMACLGALLVLFNRNLLLSRSVPIWDAADYCMPYHALVSDLARSGAPLTWNPLSNGGSPDWIDPQVGARSPITLLFGVIFGGTARGFVIYWLAIWLVGSLSMFRFARHLGADVAGAFVIAAGYSASGFYFGHAEHTAFLVSYAFLPLAAWRLDTALVDRRWIPALEAGAIWGLSGLGGYPGVLVPAGGFLVLWAVGVVLFDRRAAPSVPAGARWARGAGCVALLFFVGGLVLAPTYYGFMVEGASYTGRADPLPRELALASNALHPHGLLTFASPFLGNRGHSLPLATAATTCTSPPPATGGWRMPSILRYLGDAPRRPRTTIRS
jgi:hypothetical protein